MTASGKTIPRAKYTIFFRELASGKTVEKACDAAGLAYTTAYNLRKTLPGFERRWQEALRKKADNLEAEAWRRGYEGVDVTHTDKNGNTWTTTQYSDRLLEQMLKANHPRYRDRLEIDTTVSGSVQHELGPDTAAGVLGVLAAAGVLAPRLSGEVEAEAVEVRAIEPPADGEADGGAGGA